MNRQETKRALRVLCVAHRGSGGRLALYNRCTQCDGKMAKIMNLVDGYAQHMLKQLIDELDLGPDGELAAHIAAGELLVTETTGVSREELEKLRHALHEKASRRHG